MRIFAVVLFILLSASSSALAQTGANPDSILVEVWIANDLSSIIIAAAGWEDSSAVNGADRFFWLGNQKGSIIFSFPIYNNHDRKFVKSYLPEFDYRTYPVCCLVMENSGNVCSIYPLEFSVFTGDRIRWANEGVFYCHSRFYLKDRGMEIFNFSDNLQAQGREEDY